MVAIKTVSLREFSFVIIDRPLFTITLIKIVRITTLGPQADLGILVL